MYTPHEEFALDNDERILWRYVDLPRYIDLLIKKKLFFCRADRFEDPFEGKFNRSSEEEFRRTTGDENLKDLIRDHSSRRSCTTINCWHQNDDENFAMWQIYAKGDFGIAIQTDIGSLKSSFQCCEESIMIGKVHYFDESSDILSFDAAFSPFLNKRKVFDYENEVRCCYVASENGEAINWEEKEEKNGVFIPVDTDQLIRKVYISPNSPVWFKDVVADINEKYGVHAELFQSKVFSSMDFSY